MNVMLPNLLLELRFGLFTRNFFRNSLTLASTTYIGLIENIMPLSTVLSIAFYKFFGTPRFKPGAAKCKIRILSISLCGPLQL